MLLNEVESSTIEAVGYEGTTLEVKFKTGKTYRYQAVPEQVYNELMGSSSKGSYFAKHIRNEYTCERLPD